MLIANPTQTHVGRIVHCFMTLEPLRGYYNEPLIECIQKLKILLQSCKCIFAFGISPSPADVRYGTISLDFITMILNRFEQTPNRKAISF